MTCSTVYVSISCTIYTITRKKYWSDELHFLWVLSELLASINLHLGSVALLGVEISRSLTGIRALQALLFL